METYLVFSINTKYRTQHRSEKVNLLNSQLNKLKFAAKNVTDVTSILLSNMIGNNANNFPHNLLLTLRPDLNLRKFFANNALVNKKLLKNELCKIIKSGGFLVDFFDH